MTISRTSTGTHRLSARPSTAAAAALLACLLATGCSSRVPLYTEDRPPGVDSQGVVIDSSQVQPGYGQPVQGLDGWQGEIIGRPAPDSRFVGLQIGMSIEQVRSRLGQPHYQGAYSTGKVWIPFFFGADRHRYELAYAGQGRLVFAGGSLTDPAGSHLILIIHNPNEMGRRP